MKKQENSKFIYDSEKGIEKISENIDSIDNKIEETKKENKDEKSKQ